MVESDELQCSAALRFLPFIHAQVCGERLAASTQWNLRGGGRASLVTPAFKASTAPCKPSFNTARSKRDSATARMAINMPVITAMKNARRQKNSASCSMRFSLEQYANAKRL